MLTRVAAVVAALVLGAVVVLTPVASERASAQNQDQLGLVNVAVGDVTIARNVAVGVAAQVAANVCGLNVANVAILAALVAQNQETKTVCTITQGDQTVPVTITPAQGNGGGNGSPNQRQAGLINVAVGDVTVLENVAVGLAAQLAANLCGVSVGNVAALAALVRQTQTTHTVCTITQGDQSVPVTIRPAQ